MAIEVPEEASGNYWRWRYLVVRLCGRWLALQILHVTVPEVMHMYVRDSAANRLGSDESLGKEKRGSKDHWFV